MSEPLMYEAGGFSAFRDKWKGAGHSKLPVGGGGREGVQRIVGESNGFYWERRISHRQQSLKRGGGGKGGHWKTTYIALGRDQVNFIVAQLKSPDPIPPW